VKLVHLVGFITKQFVTMHGHTMHGHMMHGHMNVNKKNNVFCNIIHRVFKRDMVKISACKRHVKKCNDCKYLHH